MKKEKKKKKKKKKKKITAHDTQIFFFLNMNFFSLVVVFSFFLSFSVAQGHELTRHVEALRAKGRFRDVRTSLENIENRSMAQNLYLGQVK